ncbi:MAG: SRPBCC family protein [Actinobacteria bacterium]|jgi:carbon monoxide dehydrogenase subunit G|nr:SRPBCC family protein [Actinomycetota bacterium]MCL6095147.1 SRPBCC family protein [Actinomycetota bacterium]
MILHNEFTVASDIATVWAHMTDLEGVAQCVPGAKVDSFEPPNVFKGTIRLRIGPMTVDYKGQATLAEADEESRSATILLRARETKGQGSAVATVRSRLEPVAEGTKVVAETDLQITGPQAQFGKGVLEDVGARVMEEFSKRLEEQILADKQDQQSESLPEGSASAGSDYSRSSAPGGYARQGQFRSDDDALDIGRILVQSKLGNIAKVGGAVALLSVFLVLLFLKGRKGSRGSSRCF